MAEIRVLANTNRPMQRLGFLKRIARRVITVTTTNLENLGRDLLDTITRKTRVPLDQSRADYIKIRLQDRTYLTLKKEAVAWLKAGTEIEPPLVSMELQDLYLADPQMPSHAGKLVAADFDRYPLLGVSLGLIRAGTWSATTRTLALSYFISDAEQQAFGEYKPDCNPLLIMPKQGLLLLYALIDNDGEVLAPLWGQLAQDRDATFSDRDAGDRLPDIYRQIAVRHRKRMLPADARDRLTNLEKSADSISKRRDVQRYVGSSREHASRVRVEPYTDLGLLNKPDPFRYEFKLSPAGLAWANWLRNADSSEAVGELLATEFFATAARALGVDARTLTDVNEITGHLHRAWDAVHSTGGYAPIEEMALVAGIEALLDHQLIIEPKVAREAIIAYQKLYPYQVRFTVDRLGVLAHARFLDAPFTDSAGGIP
jgi:hypothetical protein